MNDNSANKVEIVDIRMPFSSIVIFMVKAAIASIPAMMILTFAWFLTIRVLGALTGG